MIDQVGLDLLIALIIASWCFWLTSAVLVWLFFSEKPRLCPGPFPPVSILKPVKAIDAEAYENFTSFCRQDYPEYELLFGVADPLDPVIGVIKQVKKDFPELPIRLVIARSDAPNRKIGSLSHLAREARYDILVVSDSDMRVRPDYLKRIVQPLDDPRTGLVTCPYRGVNPVTFTARLEALHMGVTFLPSMLVGRELLKMRFAMGSTLALRKTDLQRMGGFEAVSNYLADDYQIGLRISKLGLNVHLSDYVIESVLGITSFQEQWRRELRWSHCNRVSEPAGYLGLLITFCTPLATLLLIATSFSLWSFGFLGISLLLRWACGFWVTAWTKDPASRQWLFWLPVRDFLSAAIWAAGLFGKKVVWRGETYWLHAGGILVPAVQYDPTSTQPLTSPEQRPDPPPGLISHQNVASDEIPEDQPGSS